MASSPRTVKDTQKNKRTSTLALKRVVNLVRECFSRTPSARVVCSAQTSSLVIPPVSLESAGDDMKGWATQAQVDLGEIDGTWWSNGEVEEALKHAREGKGFVGLYFHGGGYALGSAKDVLSYSSHIPRGLIEHGICRCLISVDYSLVGRGEEENKHPFPSQILEATSAYDYLLHTCNIPSTQIILGGDSAGGHLVLALQRYLLQRDGGDAPTTRGVILLSPWCDLSVEAHIPHVQRLLGPLSQDQLSAPYFSPSLHAPPPRWPPTLLYYGANEGFGSSILSLASQLAGTQVTTYAAEEIPERFSHDFLIFRTVYMQWPAEVTKCWIRMKAWADAL